MMNLSNEFDFRTARIVRHSTQVDDALGYALKAAAALVTNNLADAAFQCAMCDLATDSAEASRMILDV